MDSPDELKAAIEALMARAQEVADDPRRFSVYKGRPVEFAEEVLGVGRVKLLEEHGEDAPGLTPRQCEILERAVRENRITIKSGHGTGKTFVMAILALYWRYCEWGLVITTASTWNQVKQVLWVEIERLWRNARVKLPGEFLECELRVDGLIELMVGVSTNDATAFQGRHHPRLLVIIDEATGVDDPIHAAISSLATDEENVIVQVGNPTEASGAFYQSHRSPIWRSITMSCLDHPNVVTGRRIIPGAVTRAWVEGVRQEHGEDSAYWQSRVIGEFPTVGSKAVIPQPWVERAENEEEWKKALKEAEELGLPRIFGLDIARGGENKTVLAIRRGRALEKIVWWQYADTMTTAGWVRLAARELQPAMIVADVVGVGGGVVDRLMELGEPVFGFHAGRPAADKTRFNNRRSEHWWQLRQRFERQDIWLPPDADPQLKADLTLPTYRPNSLGKIVVQSKDDMERSPDFADAVAMAFLMEDAVPELTEGYVDPTVQDVMLLPPGSGDGPDVVFLESGFAGLPPGY